MNNQEKYRKVFAEILSLDAAQFENDIAYNSIPQWDSIGHMTLIAALEETFGITMETDDIINFSSFLKGCEILAKYGVVF